MLLVVGTRVGTRCRASRRRAASSRSKPIVRELAIEKVAGAGHMLHHEQPRAVARLIEAFFGNTLP